MRLFVLACLIVLSLPRPHFADDKVAKPTDPQRIRQLIQQLGGKSFEERQQAVKALVDVGEPALESLKAASQSADAETRRRANSCIEEINRLLPAAIPEGVTVIRIPNETISLENVGTRQKPRLRLTYGKVVIEGPCFYIGDGRIAQGLAARPKGMNLLRPSGEDGDVNMDGEFVHGPAGGKLTVYDGLYLRADKLKPGTVYIISPAFHLASLPEGSK